MADWNNPDRRFWIRYLYWGSRVVSNLIRTNSHGDTLWTKFFPDGYATAMTRMPNGDFVIGGGITNMDQDILFLRLDSNGNKVWQSSFDGIGRDNVLDVSGLTDGSCVATGYFKR